MLLHGKKILKTSSAVVMSLLLFSSNLGAPSFNSAPYADKKNELQNKKRELAKELKKASEEVSKEKQNKDSIDKKISIVQNQIDASNDYINALEGEICSIEEQIKKIKEEMKQKIVLLRKSLVSIYKAGDTSTLDIVLGAKDFEDFLDKADMVRSVSKYVKSLIDDLKNDLTSIEKKEEEIIKTKKEQEKERSGLEKNRSELQKLFDESEKLLNNLQASEREAKKHVDQNDAQIKALDAQIERYYAEQRRREEARKKSGQQPAPDVHRGGFIWPVPGYRRISSDYSDTESRSRMHGAIDIAGAGIYGANIVASAPGKVIFVNASGYGGGYGKYVIIDHGSGISTLYGHMSSVAVSVGQNVAQGQVIGNVGSTGHSTGPHLHFEYRVNGVRRNPHEIV